MFSRAHFNDPVAQFQSWLNEAVAQKIPEPNAMTLATADADGQPFARIVLLKQVDSSGFVFFTNYHSLKGQHLVVNPKGALLFYWPQLELGRQVRILGCVCQLSSENSDAYYESRPLGSRISAWACRQSQGISNRMELLRSVVRFKKQLGKNPPRPNFWGGYRLEHNYFEFWEGKPDRLHERICYKKSEDSGEWNIFRLAP